MKHRTDEAIERFIANPDNVDWFKASLVNMPSGCRRWPKLNAVGYGYLCERVTGIQMLAHRVSLAISKGSAPQLFVLHSCDNPACCNPEHLREGTQRDNLSEAAEKGRMHRGEKHGISKLTNAQASEIKLRLRSGERHGNIAADYGVSRSAVQLISAGKNWGWL